MDRQPRILLVDDHQQALSHLYRSLRRETDFDVELVAQPRFACELLRQRHFDMVVAEEQMPVLLARTKMIVIRQYDAPVDTRELLRVIREELAEVRRDS